MTWTTSDIPDLHGKTAAVTGPTRGGLGYHTALELARRGAQVVLAGRSWTKLDDAEAGIRDEVPQAQLEKVTLDLSDFASVRAAAAAIADIAPLDVLVNNAGVMAIPPSRTKDGLDLQLATNHFGPFLLTGLLLPCLVESGAGRVVTVSSTMHRAAVTPPLGHPEVPAKNYRSWQVYGQTKLANLLFTYELDRRLRAAGLPVKALAAHPGYANTHLIMNGRSMGRLSSIAAAATRAIGQPPAHGAWPTLMAATADLPGGMFTGPNRVLGLAGPPHIAESSALSHDESVQRALWEISERTTGLTYP